MVHYTDMKTNAFIQWFPAAAAILFAVACNTSESNSGPNPEDLRCRLELTIL